MDNPYQSNTCFTNRLAGGTTGKVYKQDLDMLGKNVAYQPARYPPCFHLKIDL